MSWRWDEMMCKKWSDWDAKPKMNAKNPDFRAKWGDSSNDCGVIPRLISMMMKVWLNRSEDAITC